MEDGFSFAPKYSSYGGTSVMNRGERKEDIFVSDPDRQRFLEALGEACQTTRTRKQLSQCLQQSFRMRRTNGKEIGIVEGEQQRVFVNVQQVFIGSDKQRNFRQ